MSRRHHATQQSSSGRYGAEDVNVMSRAMGPESFVLELSVEAVRKQGELELKIGSSAIRNEYQKRLADVASMRAKASQTLQNLELERAALGRAKDDLHQLMKDFESTLDVNLQWARLRKGLAGTEGSKTMKDLQHNVEVSMDISTKDVTQAVLQIATHLEKVHAAAAEAAQAIDRLRSDIIAKSGNMVLDKACMEGLISTAAVPSPREPNSSAGHSVSRPRRDDSDWVGKGLAANTLGLHALERCTPVRKAAQELVLNLRESGILQRNPAVLDALRGQAKYTDQLDNQMELNKRSMQNQIDAISKQHSAVQAALDNVRQQLHLAKQRLRVSAARPEVDGAPTNVEDLLHLEITKLTRSEAELEGKLNGLSRHLVRTQKMVAALGTQSKENRKTSEIVKACLEVKLPPISSPRQDYSSTPRRLR